MVFTLIQVVVGSFYCPGCFFCSHLGGSRWLAVFGGSGWFLLLWEVKVGTFILMVRKILIWETIYSHVGGTGWFLPSCS